MSLTVSRSSLSNGCSYTEIIDGKFKSNLVSVKFITQPDERLSPYYALIGSVLTISNASYPIREDLTNALAELYGTSLGINYYRLSDYQCLNLGISYISDSCTIGGEVISDKAIRILSDCIFNPCIENGCFSSRYFGICQKDIIESIRGIVNNKRAYAHNRASREIYVNEPMAHTVLGSEEKISEIRCEELFAVYEKLLKDSYVEVNFCGGERPAALDSFLDELRENCGKGQKIRYFSPSPLKEKVSRVEERIDVNQCKMIMAFKSEKVNIYTDKLMSYLLGASPTSKLFMNVRERLSLCYYCQASLHEAKSVLTVDSGLDEDKLAIAETEILKQLEALQNGDFTDEELENTKLFAINNFRANYDGIGDLNSWYFYQTMRGTQYSPDDVTKILRSVTREDIINSAKSYRLDTVYVLKPLNGGDTANA